MISHLNKPADAASIDWYPFLGRPRLSAPAADELASLRDRSILVTGAGGSIGKALSLKLAAMGVRKLVLLDASEQAVYRLQHELGAVCPAIMPDVVLGSVADEPLLDEVFAVNGVNLVFHAAAHKHVPLLETNPFAAIATNALATRTLLTSAQPYGARTILLSTDKAVAPTSVLGATKQIAEHLTLAAVGVVVRLTNVLGTEGSVAETFLRQIASGEPLVIRHRDATRYFLTLEEAVDLLLTASYVVPRSSILIPNIQLTHSVLSLAEFLMETCNVTTVAATCMGKLHPCEKIHEILWSAHEEAIATRRDGYTYIVKEPTTSALDELMNDLQEAVTHRDLGAAKDAMHALVPDYQPSTTILALTQPSTEGVSQT